MMKELNIWKNVRDLALRYLMICVFVFMCIVIIATSSDLLGPLFGVFYFIALIYYFWFTMKTEGGLDVNRVKIGQMPFFRWKGAVCALILVVPLMIVNLIPNFFPDPVPDEYKAYFTGEVTTLEEDSNFNVSLREHSGKEGYISEIRFGTDAVITNITYVTSKGVRVICDGKASDASKVYGVETLNEAGETVMVYYSDDAELTEDQIAAFEECKNAVDDINDVMGSYPGWQVALTVVKSICVIALQYFCAIFAGDANPVLSSVIYCLCLLVLCVAAQVGYEMGYREISFLRKKKVVKDSKAGDSVVIQRGGRSDLGE